MSCQARVIEILRTAKIILIRLAELLTNTSIGFFPCLEATNNFHKTVSSRLPDKPVVMIIKTSKFRMTM